MVDFRQFLDNPGSAFLNAVDNGDRTPNTTTQTAYSLQLHARFGLKQGVVGIGAVHELSTSQTLQVDEEFEVNKEATGLPIELIPQILTGRTLTLQRYELYRKNIEQVFGNSDTGLLTLCDQAAPLSVRLMFKGPSPSSILGDLVRNPNAAVRIYEFQGCYLTQLGKTYSMANVIVGANATLTWRQLRRLQ